MIRQVKLLLFKDLLNAQKKSTKSTLQSVNIFQMYVEKVALFCF